jgi:MoaA/NifB/PqqE/SkfB family radical SAM enzyme
MSKTQLPFANSHSQLAPAAASERSYHDNRMVQADFSQAPFTIAWEVTRACAFDCKHCRADAQHTRDPRELSTAECLTLIDRLAEFGSPILVFTGGDPLMRRDLFDLIAYAKEKGLRCSLTPTATALPTAARLHKAKEAGIKRLALSLDAPNPAAHDDFRQVPGSWQRTLRILHNAHAAGLSAQVKHHALTP